MSGWGRDGRNNAPPAEHRSYDDYEDTYAAPKARGGRNQQLDYGDRGQSFERPSHNSRQGYCSYEDGSRGYERPQGPGRARQGWAEPKSSRGPYSINLQRQGYDQQRQQPEELQRGALTERGTKWSGAPGCYPGGGSGRPPNEGANGSGGGSGGRSLRRMSSSGGSGGCGSGGGGRRQPSNGRSVGGGNNSGSAGAGSSMSRQHSNGRAGAGRPPAGVNAAAAALRAAVADRAAPTSGAATAIGSGGRVRAPYVAAVVPVDSPAPPAADPDEDLPRNLHFLTPAFPQAPRTRTDSCSSWALMVEAGSQALEAVVGPFLEGTLMELFGEAWERELFVLELPLPPFTAATCAELVSRCRQLHERLPITIHKRVEAVAKATKALASCPASLEPEDVTAAHTAMRGMLQDCIKAMKMPSLWGAGSRQFRAFTAELAPHAESAVLYFDMLIADCLETAAVRQQARAGANAGSAGDAAAAAAAVAEST